MRKKLIIIASLVIVLAVAFGLYFYFRAKKEETGQKAQSEGLLFATTINSAAFSPDAGQIYYYSSQETPAFYQFGLSDQKVSQISQELTPIEEIVYAPNLKKCAFSVTYDSARFAQYGSPFLEPKMNDNEKRLWVYDFEKRTLHPLNQKINALAFSPDSNKIYYSFPSDSGKMTINRSNFDGSGYEKIIDWQYGEPAIKLLDENQLLLAYTTEEFESQGDGLYLLDLKNKKLSTLTNKDFSTFFSISPAKDQLFFFRPFYQKNELNSEIWTTRVDGKDKNGELKTEDEIDYQHLAWSSDGKNIYFSARPKGKENFEKLYQYQIENKKLNLILEKSGSNFQVFGFKNNLIYYLLGSQAYAAKI